MENIDVENTTPKVIVVKVCYSKKKKNNNNKLIAAGFKSALIIFGKYS